MIDLRNIQNDYIACGYTDMRKQLDGLAVVVQLQFYLELDEVSLFLFCGRKADRVKAEAETGDTEIRKPEMPPPLLRHSYASASVVT